MLLISPDPKNTLRAFGVLCLVSLFEGAAYKRNNETDACHYVCVVNDLVVGIFCPVV
jgi:hypothetical protein